MFLLIDIRVVNVVWYSPNQSKVPYSCYLLAFWVAFFLGRRCVLGRQCT